jgi:hypothetical protein
LIFCFNFAIGKNSKEEGGGKLEEGGGKLGGQMKATAFIYKLITLLRVFPGLDPGI